LWIAAARLTNEAQTGMNFHMSPAAMDPEGFLRSFGQ
jgi:hypothetical protein